MSPRYKREGGGGGGTCHPSLQDFCLIIPCGPFCDIRWCQFQEIKVVSKFQEIKVVSNF